MRDGALDHGVGHWLLRHGGFTVLASLALVGTLIWVVVHVTAYRPPGSAADAAAHSEAASQSPAVPTVQTSAASSSVPSVLVSDNSAFDLIGSGSACRMHYFQDDQGRMVTLFDLAEDGELITHVSGPDGIDRHDEQFTRGVSRIVYGFPLSQATDMGAVFYLADGSSQSCTISAGVEAP